MRLTPRDQRLLRDVALSHVLSRDQIVALGYFGSVTRLNTRLRALMGAGLLRRLETPFFGQGLYAIGPRAKGHVPERLHQLVKGRAASPRFLQHALCVTGVRLALLARGATAWRFEQQLHCSFRHGGALHEVRPDGLAQFPDRFVAVEADLGHVAPARFSEKLRTYDLFVVSGSCARNWKATSLTVLTVTTGPLRAARLRRLTPAAARFRHTCLTCEQFGVAWPGTWS